MATCFAPFYDPLTFHVRNLRQHCQDEFPYSLSDTPKPPNFDGNTTLQKFSDSSLNIQGIATETIYSKDMHLVTFPNVVEQS